MLQKQVYCRASDPKTGVNVHELSEFAQEALITASLHDTPSLIKVRVGFRGQILQLWTELDHKGMTNGATDNPTH